MSNLDQLIETIKIAAKPYYIKEDGQPFDDIHDWNHMRRVYGAAKKILEHEPKANRGEVLISAILHDIGRSMGGEQNHAENSYKIAQDLLAPFKDDFENLKIDLEKVLLIIRYHSIAHICEDKKVAGTLEFNIMTDADKIDMFGPSGVLRVPTAVAYARRGVVYWAIDRLLEESDPEKFYFQSEGGKIVGQKYKDYLRKYVDDFNAQRAEFEID